jgi:hypothetical protein
MKPIALALVLGFAFGLGFGLILCVLARML